jgi:TetR/AcrR family transcriptional regulator, repressor of the ameABC operon
MARPSTDIDAGREELLDHVEALIQQRGGVSVTLAELATTANMSPANLYRFFDSKEALYQAVAERWFAPKIGIMEEVVASDLPIREKLYEFFARRFVLMRDNHVRDPQLFESYLELGREHLDIVLGFVDLADHYQSMLISEAISDGYFEGLTIDEAVSLVNLMIQPFCNPDLIHTLGHRATEAKLSLIIDAILAGLKSGASNVRPIRAHA